MKIASITNRLSQIVQVFNPKKVEENDPLKLAIAFPLYLQKGDNYIMVINRRKVQIAYHTPFETSVKTSNYLWNNRFFNMAVDGVLESEGYVPISRSAYHAVFSSATNENNWTANTLT